MDEEKTTGGWSCRMYHIHFAFESRKADKNSKDKKREDYHLLENAIDTARKHHPKTEKSSVICMRLRTKCTTYKTYAYLQIMRLLVPCLLKLPLEFLGDEPNLSATSPNG